jgi:hypothetical protein
MEQSPSQVDSSLNCQEIRCILWKPKVKYHIYNKPIRFTILSQENPTHILTPYLRSILILSSHLHLEPETSSHTNLIQIKDTVWSQLSYLTLWPISSLPTFLFSCKYRGVWAFAPGPARCPQGQLFFFPFAVSWQLLGKWPSCWTR